MISIKETIHTYTFILVLLIIITMSYDDFNLTKNNNKQKTNAYNKL